MKDLFVYTLFNNNGKPRYTGIKAGNTINIYELYRPGARKLISVINQHKELIRDLILEVNNLDGRIITTDFKGHLAAFDLPIDFRKYNVFDLHLPDLSPSNNDENDQETVKKILMKMSKSRISGYQKLLANSAVAYQDMQKRGLLNNYAPVSPQWSLKTFAGRAKSSGFNVQGFYSNNHLTTPGFTSRDVLIHFDWICADIRAAALLSNDEVLSKTFVSSDPYTYMMNIINNDSPTKITREECKLLLLKSINSMDFNSLALSKIYTTLGDWIMRCSKITAGDGYLETLLHRRFRTKHAKNPLAVLNGAMQGSVAHGMQNTLRRVWEKLCNRVVADIYDSLVVVSSPETNEITSTISLVTDIMLHPFEGLIESNPVFPLKVSIGRKWKKWKLYATYRESGVVYGGQATDDKPESETETEIEAEEVE